MSESWSATTGSLDISTLRGLYQTNQLRPTELVEAIQQRISDCPTENIWIHRLPEAVVMAQATALEQQSPELLPLYGIPFAVKDNIDIAGQPTTAGCPDFSYIPSETATAVKLLEQAGAVCIGKTNLDQFATGLVGTRSPYGACQNSFNSAYISGGSSSGSAVAVAKGLVSFALGTDTAGSGRVPAGFNNVVGLKPSRGLISTAGVVPACRTLDCVSIFSLTVSDALEVLAVCQAEDAADPYSRQPPKMETRRLPQSTSPTATRSGGRLSVEWRFRFGSPDTSQLEFFGDSQYAGLFAKAVNRLADMGGWIEAVDFTPFIEVANLLYGGPWVAERFAAIKDFITEKPDSLQPITRQIIEGARQYTAVEVFESYYKLQALQKSIAPLWETIDCLVVPTTGTIYSIAEVEAQPLKLNSNLGYYTNFVNLLDLSALAVPNGFQKDGLPMGITLIAPAFQEQYLGQLGAAFLGESAA